MNFVPLIQGTAKRAAGKRYDCGRSGRLTVRQIAEIVGIAEESVHNRIRVGYRGERLLAPKRAGLREVRVARTDRPAILTALKLARRFPDRVPSVQEVQAVRPMDKRSACRWRQVWKAVLEGVA